MTFTYLLTFVQHKSGEDKLNYNGKKSSMNINRAYCFIDH
jgi:hypothetical protein